jgi:site-specific DNA-methyltransferase (adenine-specific)
VKERAPGNRTLSITEAERDSLRARFLFPGGGPLRAEAITNRIICGDLFTLLDRLPPSFADLLILDPPYNLRKDFNGLSFKPLSDEAYLEYLESWLPGVVKTLKPSGSLYFCGDWKNSACIYFALKKYAHIKNRIVWQREKGRGARLNWKNSSEDLWFAVLGEDYYFDVEAVKQKRRVLAPYREAGKPKGWVVGEGGKFRLTFPGNFWDDISVPYWSMKENTDHPAQKPEKLMAKLILASCPPGGLVFDPFLGSGSSAAAAKKLGRNYAGIERDEEYCCWAEKRLLLAGEDRRIQGYDGGVFWERNSLAAQRASARASRPRSGGGTRNADGARGGR